MVIGMTTIPRRIPLLERTFSSIEKQSLKPKVLYLNISKTSSEGEAYDLKNIYEILKKFKFVELNLIPKDLGPINKFYPLLDLVKDQDEDIALIDDDVVYGENIFAVLNSNKDNFVGKGFSGFIGDNNNFFFKKFEYNGPSNSLENPIIANWIETYHGVLYKRKAFPIDSEKFLKFYRILLSTYSGFFIQDEPIIGGYARMTGELGIINTNGASVIHDPQGTPELSASNWSSKFNHKITNNRICYEFVEDFLRKLRSRRIS